MNIGGLQKTSLLDYPDTLCAIIWTMGCNFRCPFCYNKQLVLKKTEIIPEEEILYFLKKRKGVLEGLSISGGEPLLQENIVNFIEKVKKMNYLIKIDTNGAFPGKLKELIDKKLVDYVSMDIKAPKKKYDKLAGVKTNILKLEQSINLIKNEGIAAEERGYALLDGNVCIDCINDNDLRRLHTEHQVENGVCDFCGNADGRIAPAEIIQKRIMDSLGSEYIDVPGNLARRIVGYKPIALFTIVRRP